MAERNGRGWRGRWKAGTMMTEREREDIYIRGCRIFSKALNQPGTSWFE